MATHTLVHPNEELAGLISDMAFHRERHHWRGRSRRAAPSSSSPSTATSAPASPTASPLPLTLAAGSTTAGSGGGGTRCRAATLAATVEGPGFPFYMASERKKRKQEEIDDRGLRDAIPPSPSL